MKRIVLTLCIFIALSSLTNAASFYKCVDSRGNVLMTDNPPPDAKCEGRGETPDLTPRERRQIELDELYNRAMSKSGEKGRTVGGAANYLCLAEVIKIAKSSGKSINSMFLDLAEDAIENRKKYTVGGHFVVIQRAASIQSIDTSNIPSCTSAMIRSIPRR